MMLTIFLLLCVRFKFKLYTHCNTFHIMQSMNTKFNKEELKGTESAQVSNTYVKDDFFDTMSCEALDKAAGAAAQKDRRELYNEQRKLDLGTALIYSYMNLCSEITTITMNVMKLWFDSNKVCALKKYLLFFCSFHNNHSTLH